MQLLGKMRKFVCAALICSVYGTSAVFAEQTAITERASNSSSVNSDVKEVAHKDRGSAYLSNSTKETGSDGSVSASTKKLGTLENFDNKKALVVTSVAAAVGSTVSVAINMGRGIYDYVKEKNSTVRDYISIGLQKQDKSLNDRNDVIESFSKALIAGGVEGFTVFDSTGHWFDGESKKEFKEPSLVFFVDGKKDQSKKIDSIAQRWLADSGFDQTFVEHVSTRIADGGFVYKDKKVSF